LKIPLSEFENGSLKYKLTNLYDSESSSGSARIGFKENADFNERIDKK
jgi:hypothetical protein